MKKILLLPLSLMFLITGYADELPLTHSGEVAETESNEPHERDDVRKHPGAKGRKKQEDEAQRKDRMPVPQEKTNPPK